jgi:serine/threonine protein phosphatase 1
LADKPFRVFVSDWRAAPGRLPENEIVCAIGDVHGQLSHLLALTDWLDRNVFARPRRRTDLVTLGDYVDRGPRGIGVVEFLGQYEPPGIRVTQLRGNHDMFLETFLHDESIDLDFVTLWLENGGGATARELGIERADFYRCDLGSLQARARARMPAAAARCLAGLRMSERIGSYLFVHGGVDPRRAPEEHDALELATMREPFLSGAGWRHDFVVVHGHTVCGPDIRPHRIACDSGAFLTGVLSCLQIETDRLRFIIATEAPGPAALAGILPPDSAIAFAWTESPES